jgi:hypothetical protein
LLQVAAAIKPVLPLNVFEERNRRHEKKQKRNEQIRHNNDEYCVPYLICRSVALNDAQVHVACFSVQFRQLVVELALNALKLGNSRTQRRGGSV